MRTNKALILMGILLLWLSIYIGGCGQTCKQQYNDLNLTFGGLVHSMNDLHTANVVSDDRFVEFADAVESANGIRLQLRELAIADQCDGEDWRRWLDLILTELEKMKRIESEVNRE